jgi:hypothetical protein
MFGLSSLLVVGLCYILDFQLYEISSTTLTALDIVTIHQYDYDH